MLVGITLSILILILTQTGKLDLNNVKMEYLSDLQELKRMCGT